MRTSAVRLAITLALLGLFQAPPAAARTWTILADGTGDAPTIQAGIDSAAIGDSVELACGTYFEYGIVMKAGITLRSETGLPGCAVIDGQQLGRVFVCANLDQNTVFTGLTITGGNVADIVGYGGGMLGVNAALTLSQCEFVANYAHYRGGGASFDQCDLIMTDCRFIANEGEMGGGGGVYLFESDGALLRCSFAGNAGIDGAGLYCRSSSPTIAWCTFLNNAGWFFGGAIYCELDASPSIDHCSLVGNQAHLGGGIMTAADSYPIMTNSIVAFSVDGSGVHCYGGTSYLTLTLTCCDVFGNEGGGYSGAIEDQTGIDGNFAADPVFCDISAGDLHLTDGSPCLPENNDCGVLIGAWGGGCATTPVRDGTPAMPNHWNVYPNPFNPQTTIAFTLGEPQQTEVAVYDLTGRLLTVLVARECAAGNHTVVWEGKDAAGRAVPSGTYVVRLTIGSGAQARKVMLLR